MVTREIQPKEEMAFVEKTEQPQTLLITPPTSPVNTAFSGSKRNSSLKVTSGQTGLPWLSHDGDDSPVDSPRSPPPKFTASPKRISVIRFPSRKRTMQKHIYSMKEGLNPVKVLIQRLKNWQLSVHYLLKMFSSIKKVESNTGNGYRKIDNKFDFPATLKDQFKSSHGVQDAWFAFRQYTRENSLIHRDFVDFIENEIMPVLKTMSKEIQHMIKTIRKDKGLRTASLWECRKRADKIITRLNADIYSAVKNNEKTNSPYFNTKRDPLLTKHVVVQTIQTLYREENRLHQQFIETQEKYREFEQDKIINVYTEIFQTFETYRTQHHLESLEGVSRVAAIFDAIESDAEWNDFVKRHDSELVNPTAAFKDERCLHFPNCSHPFVQPLIADTLQKHNKKVWVEAYYVLSPIGFLYRYASEEALRKYPLKPEIKLFVPQCTMLIHPASQLFQLQGKLLTSFFRAQVTFVLSASHLDTVKHAMRVLAPMVVQKETKQFDDVAPPEQNEHVESMQPIAETSIQPITNHNTDANSDHDEALQTIEYSTHSPDFEQSSAKPTANESVSNAPLYSTESKVLNSGPTRQGSDIFYDPN